MKNDGKEKRVLLSERNTALTLCKVQELRGSHCTLNMSDFVNAVLEIFFEKHYNKEKKSIEKQFFDEKKYLKRLLASPVKEDLEASLRSYLKKVSRSKRQQKTLDDDQ